MAATELGGALLDFRLHSLGDLWMRVRCLGLALGLAAVAGCADGATGAPQASSDAAAAVPKGHHLVRCLLLEGDGDTTGTLVTFALPKSYQPTYLRPAHDVCLFQPNGGYFREVKVTTADESLAQHSERDLEPWLGDHSDEAVRGLEYVEDVAMFGGLRGDGLEYFAANDGSPVWVGSLQSGRVRVSWMVPDEDEARGRAGLEVVRETARITPGAPSRRSDLHYEPDA